MAENVSQLLITDTNKTYDIRDETNHVFYVKGTQTASTGAWTGNLPEVDALYEGLAIDYWLPFAGSGNATLNLTLKNGTKTGAINCFYSGTTRLTIHIGANNIMRLVYQVVTISGTSYTGWWLLKAYDTNDAAYAIRNGGPAYQANSAVYRYQLLFQVDDNKLTPLNNVDNSTATGKAMLTSVDFLPFGKIYFYNHTGNVAANGNMTSSLYNRVHLDLRYSLNCGQTLTSHRDVYLKCARQANGKFRITADPCWAQTLPSTNDGYYYLRLGRAYDTYHLYLEEDHPIYYHDGTELRIYTNPQEAVTDKNITENLEYTGKATKNYTAGSLAIVNNQLLRVTQNITSGGNITIGSNAQVADLETLIAEKANASHNHDSAYVNVSGDTMTGQLKTSFKQSVAMGTYGAAATTVPNLCEELRYSSGAAGSVSIGTAYTKDSVTISTGWYNFLWIPHRSGGVNGAASGDNCNYGALYLSGMTVSGSYVIRYTSSAIAEVTEIAPTVSPAFAGTPTAPTAAKGTNTTQLATTAFVQAALSGHSADNISGGYLNIHPENNPTLIPFMNNDIAFLLNRGGSAVVTYDGTVQSVNLSNVFDGSPSYWGINPTGITTIVIELTLHKTFTYSNWIYVDFGAATWRAKSIKIEVMNTNYSDDTWTQKANTTSCALGHYAVSISHTPVGASNTGGGFNKIRFTFSSFNTSSNSGFRIAQLGIYNYGSLGLRETYVSRGGSEIFGTINPYQNNGADLGTSAKYFNNAYITKLNGVAVGSSPKFTDTNTWRGIQDNLTSDSATDSLSAKQGKALKGLVDAKAPLASPALTGNPTAPTQTKGNNSTRIATTAFVQTAINDKVEKSVVTDSVLSSATATQNYTAGKLIIVNNQLLRVTQNIASGGTITIGSNAEAVDLETVIAEKAEKILVAKLPFLSSASLYNDTADFHNAMPRGKDITSYLTDGSLWNRINGANGYSLFEDLYVGDYLTAGGQQYMIVDFDYYIRCGDGMDITQHHLVMMPTGNMSIPEGTVLYGSEDTLTLINTANYRKHTGDDTVTVSAQETADGKKWNATIDAPNTTSTAGGYKFSRMRQVIMKAADTIIVNAFGLAHIKPIPVQYPNPANAESSGLASNWASYKDTDWASNLRRSICDLPNETQIYGQQIFGRGSAWNTYGYEVGIDKWQFSLFKNNRARVNIRSYWWLRSVNSTTDVCRVNTYGVAGNHGSTAAFGVRPRFLLFG